MTPFDVDMGSCPALANLVQALARAGKMTPARAHALLRRFFDEGLVRATDRLTGNSVTAANFTPDKD